MFVKNELILLRILSLFVLHLCIIIGVDYIENYFNIPVVPAEKLEVNLECIWTYVKSRFNF